MIRTVLRFHSSFRSFGDVGNSFDDFYRSTLPLSVVVACESWLYKPGCVELGSNIPLSYFRIFVGFAGRRCGLEDEFICFAFSAGCFREDNSCAEVVLLTDGFAL